MNRFIKSLKVAFAIFMLITSVNSYAQREDTKGGGSPGPFDNANQKVELADGENYYLQGEVYELRDGTLVFGVDFKAHPWLANKYRKQKGYYFLSEAKSKINLDRVVDKKVAMNFKAKSIYFEDNKGNVTVDIELKPLSSPEILKK